MRNEKNSGYKKHTVLVITALLPIRWQQKNMSITKQAA